MLNIAKRTMLSMVYSVKHVEMIKLRLDILEGVVNGHGMDQGKELFI
jgi:hypothetical protein